MKRSDTKSILLVGVGGQGTILASKVLTTGLIAAGYDVKRIFWFPLKPWRPFGPFLCSNPVEKLW